MMQEDEHGNIPDYKNIVEDVMMQLHHDRDLASTMVPKILQGCNHMSEILDNMDEVQSDGSQSSEIFE